MLRLAISGYQFLLSYLTPCDASIVKNLDTDKETARDRKSAPIVAKLITTATNAIARQNAQTALVTTRLLVRQYFSYIKNFLTDRCIQVKVGNALSERYMLDNGISSRFNNISTTFSDHDK